MLQSKVFLNVILVLVALLCLYMGYSVYSGELFPIKNMINLVFGLLIFLALLSHRFTLSIKGKADFLNGLILFMIICLSTLMYFQRTWVGSLWGITISLFVIQESRLLFSLIQDNKSSSILTKWIIVVTALLLVIMLLFKLSSPRLYMIGLYSFAVLSLVVLISTLLKNKIT